ncbi:TnsD family Tn7-like transposition protein [Azospirillum sp. Marseille-Q6669]
MLSYFPAPYPDELLYSLLARYHRHTCSVSPKGTLEDLFGNRNVRATVDLPGHLGALSRHLPPDRGLTPERLSAELTLFPYYIAFQPPTVVTAVLAALIHGRADGIHLRLGIAATTVSAAPALRYCPACHTDALTRWGERFWRRVHQLPGVLVCPDHGVPLADSSVVPALGHQHEFIAADDRTCGSESASPVWADDRKCRAILLDIAQRSAVLLDGRRWGVNPADLTTGYRHALIDRRLASANGRVDQLHLHDAFAAVFAPACSALLELVDTTWLASIVRKHRHAFHPLHHILFGLLLDRSAPVPKVTHPTPRRVVATTEFTNRLRDLVSQGEGLRATARALNVDPNTVRLHATRLGIDTPWRPLVRPRAAAKGDPAPAIRERWLDLQRQEPQLGRKALAHRLPAEHTWLYRHDRAWLDAHSPASASCTLPAARVDWAAVDHDLATALRETAEAIVSLVPPVRVTLAELERRLGRPGWVGKRRAKLPEARAVLASNTESVEAFQLRRIAWAKEVLEWSEGLAPAWKVNRLARLPTRVSAAVRQALATTPQNGPITPCR